MDSNSFNPSLEPVSGSTACSGWGIRPNTSLRFVCRQVELEVANASIPWTAGLEPGDRLSIPAKHTTGRYWAPGDLGDQVVLRYAPGHNFNGSHDDIAGVCNEAGNVLGLMPHPEHAVDALSGSVDGLRIIGAPVWLATASSA